MPSSTRLSLISSPTACMCTSQWIFDPGSINFPVSGGKISPTLPTAHSINSPRALLGIRRTAGQTDNAFFILLEKSERVMHNPAAVRIGWFDLDGTHPPRLGDSGLDHRPEPFVHGASRKCIRRRFNDEIRFSEFRSKLPAIRIRKLDPGWQVAPIAKRRTGIGPADDRRNFLVAQGLCCFLNSWMPIDVSISQGGITRDSTLALIDFASLIASR